MKIVLALDLEGTLISNGVSQIPRPGLYPFLEDICEITPEIVIFTTLSRELTRQIQGTLTGEGAVPEWFLDLPYVPWSGRKKKIDHIRALYPGESIVPMLVDDHKLHAEGQEEHIILLEQFAPPYEADTELKHAYPRIREQALWLKRLHETSSE